LQEERLFGATLLIFANKQDLPSALSVDELEKVCAGKRGERGMKRKRGRDFDPAYSPSHACASPYTYAPLLSSFLFCRR
jgi:hypothetical protein